MAIRKDLDDMLNNLKANRAPKPLKKAEKPAAPPTVHAKSKFDDMSVDDLLSALADDTTTQEMQKITETTASVYEANRKTADQLHQELLQREEEKRQAVEAARRAEIERIAKAKRKAAAEEAMRRAEEERIAEEKRLAEEAARRAEEERIAEEKRLAEEAARRAEEERIAEEKRRAEEAARRAEEERIAEEKRRAEEAARRAEEERIAEEKHRAEEAARRAEEELFTNGNDFYIDEINDEPEPEESPKKGGLFSLFRKRRETSDDAEYAPPQEQEVPEEIPANEDISGNEPADEDNSGYNPNAVSFEEECIVVDCTPDPPSEVDQLLDAAIAAVNSEVEAEEAAEDEPESDPVGGMINSIRESAEKAVADLESPRIPEEPEEEPLEELPPIKLIEPAGDDDDEDEDFEEKPKKSIFKRKGKVTSALENILDEDPDAIMDERREHTEEGDEVEAARPAGRVKKTIYAILGVIFAALACIGLVTCITKIAGYWGRFSSGDTKKDGFSDIVYPAVIMDISSFESPSELSSEEIITAAIWSMVMSDNALDKYQRTFDVVSVPAVDVEAAAVALFGDGLPELTHTTVGPAEARFYYNEESKSYNVPVTPVTYTYSPEIESVSKNGSEYTIVVNYINELPSWVEPTSTKKVQFHLNETNEGYQIRGMEVLSALGSL